MNAFPRSLFPIGIALRLAALAPALLLVAAAPHAAAQGTRLWTQSRIDEFEKGTPQGVELTSDGHLRQGPAFSQILTTPSTFVWTVAVDKSGTAYLGTGSPATVLRVGADGKSFTLFETKDIGVQSVRLGPDGALYAATLPSGKVYRLDANAQAKQDDSTATVVFDAALLGTGPGAAGGKTDAKLADGTSGEKNGEHKSSSSSHYIWDLTFDASGKLYIAAGGPGAVYRVDPAHPQARPETFFLCDEQHIRTLAWDAHGNLIAGTDGSGLVYRIDPTGKGYVLFESPRREITSVAVGADGTIYAASVGDKSRNPLPPLPVQGMASITITIAQPGSLQAANASASLPEGTEIYALSAGSEGLTQAPRKLWSGKDEIVYALAARPDGLLALSGNRGRLFLIAPDGSYADVGRLDAQQALSLADAGSSGLLIGSGNTGQLYRFGAASAAAHEYSSDVLDAGALARFGRIEAEPGSQKYDILTRSGNVEQPARGRKNWGWSDWQPLKDGQTVSPAGRFFQWKAVLHDGGALGNVGVNYLPVNSAPVVDELVVVPGARLNGPTQAGNLPTAVNIGLPSSGQTTSLGFDAGSAASIPGVKDKTAVAVRWAAHDDNGDDMVYSLYLRGDGETVWRLLKDNLTDKSYGFDATLIPDGGYQIRVVASDAPSHIPTDVLTGDKVSERFEVDTTPPVVTLKAEPENGACEHPPCAKWTHVTFEAEDAFSAITHAEYSLDAGPWQFIDPVGGLSDSKRERYELHLPPQAFSIVGGEHLITVRAYDRHDNIGVAKTVIHAAK